MSEIVGETGRDSAGARRDVIRARLAALGMAGGAGTRPFPKLTGPGPHPLSSGQRRMWFAQQHMPDGAGYNICAGFRIEGELDAARLRDSFQAVAAEQEVLRTVYHADAEGLPVQTVLPSTEVTLTAVALSRGAEDLAAAVDDLVRRHGGEAFDLTTECPLRLLLVRIGPGDHVLVLIAHHIALDDLSWEPLLSAAARHYAGDSTSRPPATRFVEFASWEREREQTGDFADSLRHWRRALRPWPGPALLPTDGVRGDPSATGVRRRIALPADVGTAVTALAENTGTTTFMVVLAALRALLHRYAPDRDPAVGTIVVPKSQRELEGLVGNFGNTVLVHTEIDGDPTFLDVLQRVRQSCLDAFDHQEVPFDAVVEELRPARPTDGTGLFSVMFTQRGDILRGVEFPGLNWSEFTVFNGTARFDLAIELLTRPSGPVVTATGSGRLFHEHSLDRLLGHLTTLLTAAVAAPERVVSELPVLTDAERSTVVEQWNATDHSGYLPAKTLTALLAEQTERTPEAIALVWDGGRLSYGELDVRANQLAHELVAQGAKPGGLVGVLLPRSPESIVAMIATLKAGCGFIALDADWPPLRISEIVSDADLAVVITTADRSHALYGTCRPPVVVDIAIPVNDRPVTAPDVTIALDDTAYVVYTSGSTGTPKGVMITHGAIVNRLPWQIDLLGLTDQDGVLHKAPMSFDISINEIFLPLAAGARLVLAPPGAEGDVTALLDTIARHGVTFIYLVSSLLDLMVDREDASAAFTALRHVWCGGEVLTVELYRRFRQRCAARMYHGYGPAETTIGVTCRVLDGAEDVRHMTIGRPNPNNRVYVLDAQGSPVPIGVVGELHIGGVQVAKGYLNDPERTAEKFVPDPFRPGGTLYRSGDLARYRSDGQIVFVGRADNQVKIGGRRVELEEIEAKLAGHPVVRQAVVLFRGGTLVAHVAVGDAVVGGVEIAEWLGRRLPGHMVPSVVQPRPALPVKASGKVDREALAEVELAGPDRTVTAFTAPADGAQRAVAAIWARLLETEQVGVDDNFFDLGGHSMLVLRLQAEIRRELGKDVPVVQLFERPTVRLVADLIGGGADVDDEERKELAKVRDRAVRQRRGRSQPVAAGEGR
ncbi:non-ribosomal peptide synthetase [Lentzea flaviverrucosa]|uniref:Amino acid adenylation domain-containing protein n=1 Tax=Lentzea flaviverrucosa TaxID=200379 RepID=A0A1H9F8P3_9PSEU|nr:non-ribosomal peptide synthetase [Lentzea flaviverrucosa]RDI35274.1 amino acid adenylation domain-containing protein [Lentzea flaviverrucosa]SEQ34277.1 amino acid adenylation domain-containing protein [Lentzea flaviverrucosa]